MSNTPCKTLSLIAALAILLTFGAACNAPANATPAQLPTALPSDTPLPPPATPLPATPTLEPSPTPTHVPQVEDYLLSPSDLSVEIFKNRTFQYLEPDGAVTHGVRLFNAGVARMENTITVAPQPYTELPDLSGWGDSVQDASLGPNSAAFTSNQNTVYAFYEGNALVQMSSDLPLAELVDFGKTIQSRLPDSIPLMAISFPEQVDETAFSQYFKSVTLAKEGSGSGELVPTTVFSQGDTWCLAMESGENRQPFSLAIYDVQEKEYVYRIDLFYSFYCDYLYGVTHPGNYELRLAVDDTIVAKLPFEIQ